MSEKNDLGDLAEDYAEFGLDSYLSVIKEALPILNPISQDIPIVKTIVTLLRAPKSITDALLARNVSEFLRAADLTDEKEEWLRSKFSDTARKKLWQTVFHSLNSHDSEERSRIVGLLFDALVEDKITKAEFYRLVHAANNVNLENLRLLIDYYKLDFKAPGPPTGAIYDFVTLGLVDMDQSLVGATGGGGPTYPRNSLGWKFCGIVANHPSTKVEGVTVGVGELVEVLDSETQQAKGECYPIAYVEEHDLMHSVADMVIVNAQKQMLGLYEDDEYPSIFGTRAVVKMRENPAACLAEQIQKDFGIEISPDVLSNVRQYKIGMDNVSAGAYILPIETEGGDEISKKLTEKYTTRWLSSNDLHEIISNPQLYSDRTRYLFAAAEEVDKGLWRET